MEGPLVLHQPNLGPALLSAASAHEIQRSEGYRQKLRDGELAVDRWARGRLWLLFLSDPAGRLGIGGPRVVLRLVVHCDQVSGGGGGAVGVDFVGGLFGSGGLGGGEGLGEGFG